MRSTCPLVDDKRLRRLEPAEDGAREGGGGALGRVKLVYPGVALEGRAGGDETGGMDVEVDSVEDNKSSRDRDRRLLKLGRLAEIDVLRSVAALAERGIGVGDETLPLGLWFWLRLTGMKITPSSSSSSISADMLRMIVGVDLDFARRREGGASE
jgi:hypothetical protein